MDRGGWWATVHEVARVESTIDSVDGIPVEGKRMAPDRLGEP